MLDLTGNQITGRIPPELANLTNLVFLTLNGNNFSAGACIPAVFRDVRSTDTGGFDLPFCEG